MSLETVVSATELCLRIREDMPHRKRWWKCKTIELSFVFVCVSSEQFRNVESLMAKIAKVTTRQKWSKT